MTSTSIPTDTTPRHTKRWAFVAPIAVAGIAAISFGSGQFTSSSPAPSGVSDANTAVAAQGIEGYARINGLSGLSPASMSAPYAPPTLADYFRANGLSGLSPASVTAAEVPANLADYARINGLSGLSPASLAPIDTDD